MDPQTIITIIGAGVGGMGVVLTFLATRGKTKTDAKTALDARIDKRVSEQLEGAWTEITALKTDVATLTEKDRLKSSAFARILRAIARQWPTDHGPDLDPSDIALIEDTIPPTWLRKHHPRPEGDSIS
ncbi:hypothetical protein F6W69_10735 [Microbacterium oxydans]|uniref:hypothetical protein n=1 Tax=Microbacterium oxydans TaxID=82380 RepID=UPI00114298A1|nr:hypothetical protein [Microbacterium oxydans]KAB1891064.1 hypothetical protein F6W69_10735 [Microbacterium oxydans]GED39074.1 hypothetical protein MOX01_22160 [Microbacterium oxydans]